jgi:hypothetical protein
VEKQEQPMRYYHPSNYSIQRQVNRARKPAEVIEYTVDTVWGAAAYANRINGGYFKDGVWNVDAQTGTQTRVKEPNRDLVKLALADQTKITEQDRALGVRALGFLAQQLTLKALKGKTSDFDTAMSKVVAMTGFTNANRLEIALVASQISAYERAEKELAVAERIDHSKGYLADIGTKVQAQVEITRAVYSQNYNVYFLSGITDTNQAVFFSYREKFHAGTWITIKGTVKAHRPDSTQLSRVRVI